jgi:hypothetical protein
VQGIDGIIVTGKDKVLGEKYIPYHDELTWD